MENNVTFYTRCMSDPSMYSGFVSEKVAMAGNSIEGLGHVFLWAGDMFTNYGWSGGMLSTFGLGIGKVAEVRGAGREVTDLATGRLKETAGALIIGLALAAIGGPMSYVGQCLASRDLQCRVGNALDFRSFSENQGDL